MMREISLKTALMAALLGLLGAGRSRADIVISTLPSSSNIGSFGTPDSGSTPTYGETFTAPAGNPYFQSFEFFVANPSASALPFQGYVYAWNGTSTTGSALFTSGPLSIAPTGVAFNSVVVDAPDTLLTPGNQYIAFFSTIGFTGGVGGARFLTSPENSYTGGTFSYSNASTFGSLPNSFQSGIFGDLTTNLTFTSSPRAVPEPSSIALTAFGGLAGGLMLRRRRRAA